MQMCITAEFTPAHKDVSGDNRRVTEAEVIGCDSLPGL